MSTAMIERRLRKPTCWYPHVSRDTCPGCANPPPETRPLVVLSAVGPYLVKAHRGDRLVGYTIRDGYGWAVVAVQRGRLCTIDRCDPPGAEGEVRDVAVRRLWFYAITGGRPQGVHPTTRRETAVTEPENTTPDTLDAGETQSAEEEATDEAAASE